MRREGGKTCTTNPHTLIYGCIHTVAIMRVVVLVASKNEYIALKY